MEGSVHPVERVKHLFLSLLQARVGSSLVSRLGDLAPAAVFEVPFADLVGWSAIPEKAARVFDELQRGFPIPLGGRLESGG